MENKKTKKKISKDLKHAIQWAAAEFNYIKELKEDLEEIEQEKDVKKEVEEIKKAIRILRYVGRAERRAARFEEKVEKNLKEIYDELSKTLGFDFSFKHELMQLIREIDIEHNALVKYTSIYEGLLREELTNAEVEAQLLADLNGDHSGKKAEQIHATLLSLIHKIQEQVKETEKWVTALEASLNEATQLTKKIWVDKKGNHYLDVLDVLFIIPPLRTYFMKEIFYDDFGKKFDLPYGALSIASYLHEKNVGVSILPLDYYPEKMIKSIILKKKPKVIGISAYTIQVPNAYKIFKLIKKIDPKIITIFGGPHAMFMDKEALKQDVDVVVRGEGEWTMQELMQRINENKNYEDVIGISYKKNGKPIRNSDRPLGGLGDLPVPLYSLLPKDYVKNSNVELMTSRGCYYDCSFCISCLQYKRKVRYKSLAVVAEELKILHDEYGVKEIGILDEMINADPANFKSLCGIISKFKDISFFAQTRANFVNDKDLKLMKKVNIKSLVVGAESASEKVLKTMNKRIKWEQVRTALEKIKAHGLGTGTFWIMGHPGSSPTEEEKTLEAIEYLLKNKLSDYLEVNIFIPYPGTAVFNNQSRYGINIFNWNYEDWGRLGVKPIHKLNGFSDHEIYAYFEKAIKLMKKYGRKNAAIMPVEP